MLSLCVCLCMSPCLYLVSLFARVAAIAFFWAYTLRLSSLTLRQLPFLQRTLFNEYVRVAAIPVTVMFIKLVQFFFFTLTTVSKRQRTHPPSYYRCPFCFASRSLSVLPHWYCSPHRIQLFVSKWRFSLTPVTRHSFG